MESMHTNEISIKPEDLTSENVKTSKNEEYMFSEFFELRQLLQDHEKNWLTVKNFNGLYFGMAIRVAILILDNAQFNIENIKVYGKQFPVAAIHFTSDYLYIIPKQVQPEQNSDWKPKVPFTQVFPMMSELIKNILDITKDTNITKERKYQVANDMMDLVDFAIKKDLMDFDKFKPDEAKAKWQYTSLMKSLDTIT
ncbi:MAG: hypothetical protein OXC46_05895 [Thaumarchaeota archaeon]|nr:hypothetical protein [Nitrososphaerota archaeon]